MNTKELIKNTFGAVLALTIIIFVIVFIAYGCSGINDHLKETLTITIGFFGGFATLGAAYIAANLFNDWGVQHNKSIEIKFIFKIIDHVELFDTKISKIFFVDYKNIDAALNHDDFILKCISMEFDVRVIKDQYQNYCNFLKLPMPNDHEGEFNKLIKSIKKVRLEDNQEIRKRLIKIHVFQDLIDFIKYYNENINPYLFKNLKALN